MTEEIIAGLPLPLRLALSYAPARSRSLFLGFFALDSRLSLVIRQGREPILAQMRLAWWRETLEKDVDARPSGEPLLEVLAEWRGEELALVELAEGWEILLGEPPLAEQQIMRFGQVRGRAVAALARLSGEPAHAEAAGRAGLLWAMADLAGGVTEPAEREAALSIVRDVAQAPVRLPPALRPLTVLAGLARRSVAKGGRPLLDGASTGLLAMRLGILGR